MKIRNLHLNILLGLNSFIIFFLIFEDKIDIPVYLQVFGRMHPLLLHFPIVLLFLSWLLICFRRSLEKVIPETRPIVGILLFISALFASVTVIIGLFLAQEGGYEGSSFEWHKWTGVALSLLAPILLYYNIRQDKERYGPVFLGGINLSLLLLIMVGHFGATLTHGDNFVWGPLNIGNPKKLDMERDLVYEDAVYRILDAKCISCHSDNKPKGNLVMSDTESLVKGGKNGPLFVPGSPEESLMVERLLLDMDDKHRMPPKGKPQLTDAELNLIQTWISNGAQFNLPLSVWSQKNDLAQAVKAVYEVEEGEHYDFPAADTDLIASLETPYRIIKPLAGESPALHVSFYGKDFFNGTSLPELSPIAEQVISLNLSGMPVKSDDLKLLKNFGNLQTLNLNYTGLEDGELMALTELPALKSLSISGTAISQEGAKKLLAIPTLRKIFVWNTPLGESDLAPLDKEFPVVHIDRGEQADDSAQLPLTPPKINPPRSFYRNELPISFSHPIPGVEIRYTLDGSDPDSTNALVYDKPLLIDNNLTLRVKGFKSGWMPSEEIIQTYRNSPIAPNKIELNNRPHHLYRGREQESLFDLESGGNNHADGKWIGFRGDDILSANFYFDTPKTIDTLSLSIKQHYNVHNVFIYPPEEIEIWAGRDSESSRMLGKFTPKLDKPGEVRHRRMISFPIKKDNIGYIKLIATPYRNIPEGFPASGRQAWLFMDEIVIK